MEYLYTGIVIAPNLIKLEGEIDSSAMTDKSIEWCRWDESSSELKLLFTNSLIAADKTILDGLVAVHDPAYPEGDFNVGLCLMRLSQDFTNIERMNLSKIAPTFIAKIQTKNFVELKEILDYLVETTLELPDSDRIKVKNILLEQGIDLNTY